MKELNEAIKAYEEMVVVHGSPSVACLRFASGTTRDSPIWRGCQAQSQGGAFQGSSISRDHAAHSAQQPSQLAEAPGRLHEGATS